MIHGIDLLYNTSSNWLAVIDTSGPARPRATMWRSRRVVINTFKKLMILMFIPVYAIATCNPPASAQGKTQDTLSVCSAH